MSVLGGLFGAGCSCELSLDPRSGRQTALKGTERQQHFFLYTTGEDVSGTAEVGVKPGSKFEHHGVKVEVFGQLESDAFDTLVFLREVRELLAPGTLSESTCMAWCFQKLQKTWETYTGTNVKVRYFVRMSVLQEYGPCATQELDFLVSNRSAQPEEAPGIRLGAALKDQLDVELVCNKDQYCLSDVIVGKVMFRQVRLNLRSVELNLVRRESVVGKVLESNLVEHETLTKYQILDGSPSSNHWVPFRLYLAGYSLTPTYTAVQDRFSVHYFINLVILDCDGRRHSKQHEVVFYRGHG